LKKMNRNQVKTGGQTMLAERMASTKKIAATNYSCWYILSVSDYFLAEEHLKDLLKVVACTRRIRRRR